MIDLPFSEEEYFARMDNPDRPATMGEAVKEWARNVGRDNLDRQWLLTDYDTWERNPFYSGPPQRHPEDDSEDWEESNWEESDESEGEDDDSYDEYDDGQPSEWQEWHDFDPDC